MSNKKKGFWVKEPEKHYCSVCGTPASVDAIGNEDITSKCRICGSELLAEPDLEIERRMQSLTVLYDTKIIQDVIIRSVQHQIQAVSEKQYEEIIMNAVNDRCAEIQRDAVEYLNQNKRAIIAELTKKCVEAKFEDTVVKVVSSFIRGITKEILADKEDEIRRRIIESFFQPEEH